MVKLSLPSPLLSRTGRVSRNKKPHAQARGAEGTLLYLVDLQDFNIICAARRLYFDAFANLVTEDGFADR